MIFEKLIFISVFVFLNGFDKHFAYGQQYLSSNDSFNVSQILFCLTYCIPIEVGVPGFRLIPR